MIRGILALMLLTTGAQTFAADSVVIGHGKSNWFFAKAPCPPGDICLDAQYVWLLHARRTVAGPPVKGEARAISMQHVAATPRYVHSVELFVLRPIDDAALRKSSGAAYYLVALSPRYPSGRYCLAVNPVTLGIHLSQPPVRDDEESFCFDSKLLR